jgi:hypothetical protein
MDWKRRFFGRVKSVALLAALMCGPLTAAALAQSRQCGDYVEAYKAGPQAYGAYLASTTEVAKARDAQEGGKRYTKALQTSSAPSNALWLNNWCTKNPLRGFVEASSRLLDELTGQTEAASPAAMAATQPTQIVVVAPPPSPEPSACRVGDVGQCRGCSVTCGNGSQAKCKPGMTVAGPEQNCAFQAKCECAFDKNSAGPQPSGMSSCRIGDVGQCSGCSVTCNNGQSPVCKPGSTFADGEKCAFQSKCSCK